MANPLVYFHSAYNKDELVEVEVEEEERPPKRKKTGTSLPLPLGMRPKAKTKSLAKIAIASAPWHEVTCTQVQSILIGFNLIHFKIV